MENEVRVLELLRCAKGRTERGTVVAGVVGVWAAWCAGIEGGGECGGGSEEGAHELRILHGFAAIYCLELV